MTYYNTELISDFRSGYAGNSSFDMFRIFKKNQDTF